MVFALVRPERGGVLETEVPGSLFEPFLGFLGCLGFLGFLA
jgi:hypothetical protein